VCRGKCGREVLYIGRLLIVLNQCIYNGTRGYLGASMHTRMLEDLETNVDSEDKTDT